MSLIICTECEKEFSNKAEACPNCGCPTVYSDVKHIECDECGTLVPGNEFACPNCGNPMKKEIKDPPEKNSHANEKPSTSRDDGGGSLISVSLFSLFAILVILSILFFQEGI